MTSTANERLVAGRYRLGPRLGSGSMGAVWLGRDELLGREVAVKQVLLPAGTDPAVAEQQRRRAMREGRIAARLTHPHAISVYDVALEDGVPWLVMEYLPSRSLAEVLHQDGVLLPDQVAQVGAQLADALVAVHAAGIVHRDVKPGNVLVGRGPRVEGLVKITDFGIAHASGDVTLTQTGQITGTPAFLAPEVAQGSEMTPASDVFSLGATLYTCLEGQPPFGMDDNALRLLHRVAAGDVRPPRRAGSLQRPLERMLDADPARRPAMTEVRDELVRLAAGRDGDPTTVLLARTALGAAPGRTRTADLPSGRSPGAAAVAPSPPAGPPPEAVDPPTPVSPPTLVDEPAPAAAAQPAPAPPAAASPGTDPPPAAPAPDRPAPRPAPLVVPRRRGRRPLLVALAVALVVLAASLGTWLAVRDDGSGGEASADPGTSSSEAPADDSPAGDTAAGESTAADEPANPSSEGAPSSEAPDTAAQEPTASETTQETSPAPPDPATEARQTLEQYYTLLPGDPAAAYELTGPTLRSRASYGYYEDFFSRWSEINLLDLRDVTDQGDRITATTEVEFLDGGERLVETHAVTFVRGDDGRLLIDLDVLA
ncbi:Serine/threonine protein kinase [Geodermatophilus obscurus]|uniref:non-specific serine/threonine protein kinase n=1 Tax=Geodermatophilus obscurus TaxID=1861 RepID=A0A1I5EJ47_9ACTN|nr:serine/threonine-protein kinase [Geodermatophilus obscurus]SFO11091.1 Serine/threonine protein kinase [Geodermatophilus obscurus]